METIKLSIEEVIKILESKTDKDQNTFKIINALKGLE